MPCYLYALISMQDIQAAAKKNDMTTVKILAKVRHIPPVECKGVIYYMHALLWHC